jgi:hypothetical protein
MIDDRAGLALRGHEVGAALAQPGVDQALDGEAGLHGPTAASSTSTVPPTSPGG